MVLMWILKLVWSGVTAALQDLICRTRKPWAQPPAPTWLIRASAMPT
jgi:hypothetical protein